MINECSNSWLEMVPTIEGGNPRCPSRAKRGEWRAEGATQPIVDAFIAYVY